MKYEKDGFKKAIIIEDSEGWTVKTEMILHDIIQPIDFFKFNSDEECTNYVREFFKKPVK